MPVRSLLKFYRYAFALENYLLLARVIGTAVRVRRCLDKVAGATELTPELQAALPVISRLYLAPRSWWRISDPEKIARFATLAVSFPVRWGMCLQRSLIVWRLLNGYGFPARLCIGISRSDPGCGHVWVTCLHSNGQAFAEAADPHEHFTLIYASPLPE